MITDLLRPKIYAAIAQKCRELRCEPLAIGGMEDHVHLLARLQPVVAVSKLVQEVKGASSDLVTHQLCPGSDFKWQGAYGAISVVKSETPAVERYILNQKEHHSSGTIEAEWELEAGG